MSSKDAKTDEEEIMCTPAESVLDDDSDSGKTVSVTEEPLAYPRIGIDEKWKELGPLSSFRFKFATPCKERPGLVLAIRKLKFRNDDSTRVWLSATNVQREGFDLDCTPMREGRWLGIVVDYLEILDKHQLYGFQHGECTMNPESLSSEECDKHFKTKRGKNSDIYVPFSHPYETPPKVCVWITGFLIGHGENLRMNLSTKDIKREGFTLTFGTWSDTILIHAKATWVAYNADAPGICSGIASTTSFRNWHYPQHYNSGYISFGEHVFTRTPRVMTGINEFDFCGRDLKLGVGVSNVTRLGMTWNANSWKESTCYAAGLAYLAME